jgi:hypothetical protein
MVALLPPGDLTIFFANVAALRRMGALRLFAGSKTVEEPEYQQFVRQTRFDYRTDIEAVTGAADGKQMLLLIHGRFDWGRLRQYVMSHGGACKNSFCSMPTSKPGRWASFLSIQSDVMGLAVSNHRSAALTLSLGRDHMSQQLPSDPVWLRVSRNLLENPVSLPMPLRILAISLQSANRVLLSLNAGRQSGATFSLQLDAQCPTTATADSIKTQLEIQTRMLRMELAREHLQPSRSDFAGMLAAGSFHVSDSRVTGIWPIHKELLNSLK